MTSVAAGGGDYTFLVIMLVVGLINWIVSKVKEAAAPPPKSPRPIAPTARKLRPTTEDAEAERMRRFMEALGIPSDAAPPKPIAPLPPVVARQPVAPPPLPPTPVKRRVIESLDEADAPTLPVEQIELEVPEIPEFATVSSRISAIPVGTYQYASTADEPAAAKPVGGATMAELVMSLRSPSALRQAFIFREILGPPRSLQQ